ncbi:MAG: hypothetical protein DSM107014_04510 [Gomphosphaeria aponina SAG 52.96 = DSM 107014]|uniref:Uncharacterized protein n=1 Tax=Gomphosphaeria aponina SAG 52.96 = DSM 107014 TaxID=1521640 RepID=A0A941GU43_9CHRO|nr:hypothetical protein [Gomphosphaeria aponina SAG 52.96 = DSM 107014]
MNYIFTKTTNQTKILSPLQTKQLRYFKVSCFNSATPVFSGTGSLVPILEDVGFEIGRDFASLCDLCWSIFSDEEKTQTIKDYFEKIQLFLQDYQSGNAFHPPETRKFTELAIA